MRNIIITTFVTLDGVIQSPGGPEEDPTGGFRWGGWVGNYWDELMGRIMDEFMTRPFDLLLGRRTYDIFAAYWPYEKNGSVAEQFNLAHKYVVSSRPQKLSWKNSSLITGDVPAELKKLKGQEGKDLWVHGSAKLIQTLLANQLVDRLYAWIFPATIGTGKRLFAEGTQPQGLKLVDAKVAGSGVIIAEYTPAGDLVTVSIDPSEPTEAELARRKQLSNRDI